MSNSRVQQRHHVHMEAVVSSCDDATFVDFSSAIHNGGHRKQNCGKA